jgi:hypothetical protein
VRFPFIRQRLWFRPPLRGLTCLRKLACTEIVAIGLVMFFYPSSGNDFGYGQAQWRP